MTAEHEVQPVFGEIAGSDGPFEYQVVDVERAELAAHLTRWSANGWFKDFQLPIMPLNARQPYFTVCWRRMAPPQAEMEVMPVIAQSLNGSRPHPGRPLSRREWRRRRRGPADPDERL